MKCKSKYTILTKVLSIVNLNDTQNNLDIWRIFMRTRICINRKTVCTNTSLTSLLNVKYTHLKIYAQSSVTNMLHYCSNPFFRLFRHDNVMSRKRLCRMLFLHISSNVWNNCSVIILVTTETSAENFLKLGLLSILIWILATFDCSYTSWPLSIIIPNFSQTWYFYNFYCFQLSNMRL